MKSIVMGAFTVLALTVGCTGENAKDATAAVVGKGIEMGKGTVTGLAAGVDQGRKNAESADGAHLISSSEELAKIGNAKVSSVTDVGEGAKIDILVENTTDKPLRATKLEIIVLDKDGVLTPSTTNHVEVTVPPHAKAKVEVNTGLKADKVGTVRLYGQDLPR
ncbi:MAG: FxLYD domain-containing protein [Deltaproteobacteria bacterium]|nr:FxLYD domain-containing protein [Deltaproteobacteria bacterium]